MCALYTRTVRIEVVCKADNCWTRTIVVDETKFDVCRSGKKLFRHNLLYYVFVIGR